MNLVRLKLSRSDDEFTQPVAGSVWIPREMSLYE